MDALIELERISKNYGSLRALNDVSLQIEGGITGLLGPNGAGKSTLIKILLGLLQATSGCGRLLNYELGRQNREIRANVGYMPEDDCYLHGLSGVESVQLLAQLSLLPRTEALRRAHEILDFCGIQQERYRLVETYSTGMRQKLRFAQAIVHDPPILILDEPTSGLDPHQREAMLNRFTLLAREKGKTILLCTHILPDVQAISDAVIILAKGRVQVADRLKNLNHPTTPTIEVQLCDEVDGFVESLRAAGLEAKPGIQSVVVSGGPVELLTERIWQSAHQSGTGIRSLVPSCTSLEEIFLSAIQEETHGHS
ncbi:MAG: ABC transporter ATP-binding protein [Pirellulales bacterium]